MSQTYVQEQIIDKLLADVTAKGKIDLNDSHPALPTDFVAQRIMDSGKFPEDRFKLVEGHLLVDT